MILDMKMMYKQLIKEIYEDVLKPEGYKKGRNNIFALDNSYSGVKKEISFYEIGHSTDTQVKFYLAYKFYYFDNDEKKYIAVHGETIKNIKGDTDEYRLCDYINDEFISLNEFGKQYDKIKFDVMDSLIEILNSYADIESKEWLAYFLIEDDKYKKYRPLPVCRFLIKEKKYKEIYDYVKERSSDLLFKPLLEEIEEKMKKK